MRMLSSMWATEGFSQTAQVSQSEIAIHDYDILLNDGNSYEALFDFTCGLKHI
jgi:hypothetical protein